MADRRRSGVSWTDCGYSSDGAMNANWTFPVQVVVSMYAGGQESGPTVSASAVKAYPSWKNTQWSFSHGWVSPGLGPQHYWSSVGSSKHNQRQKHPKTSFKCPSGSLENRSWRSSGKLEESLFNEDGVRTKYWFSSVVQTPLLPYRLYFHVCLHIVQ